MIRILISAAFVLLLGACASSSPVSISTEKAEALRFQTKPGMAAIYVYRRARTQGAFGTTYVAIDGKPHSHFNPGFMKVDVPPGQYTVTTYKSEKRLPQNTSHYMVSVDAGEVAMLEVNILRENTNEVYRIANNAGGMAVMKQLPFYPGAYQKLDGSAAVDQVKLLQERRVLAKKSVYEKLVKEARKAQEKKDFRKAIALYSQAIAADRGAVHGDEGRLALIGMVKDLKHQPEPPEEFRKHTIRAKAYMDLDKFDAVARELLGAVNAAPWLAEPYYNYALIEEKLGFPSRAKWALQWFIKIGASPELAVKAEESMIRLEVFEEEKAAINSMNGVWVAASNVNAIYKVRVDGDKLTVYAPDNARLDGTISGDIIEGYFKGNGHTQNGCLIPGESVKLYDSSLSPDHRKMTVKYSYTLYKTNFQTDLFGGKTCISVTPHEKKEVAFTLIKKE
jgi:tetratricopeptide (TPR) repeat protein